MSQNSIPPSSIGLPDDEIRQLKKSFQACRSEATLTERLDSYIKNVYSTEKSATQMSREAASVAVAALCTKLSFSTWITVKDRLVDLMNDLSIHFMFYRWCYQTAIEQQCATRVADLCKHMPPDDWSLMFWVFNAKGETMCAAIGENCVNVDQRVSDLLLTVPIEEAVLKISPALFRYMRRTMHITASRSGHLLLCDALLERRNEGVQADVVEMTVTAMDRGHEWRLKMLHTVAECLLKIGRPDGLVQWLRFFPEEDKEWAMQQLSRMIPKTMWCNMSPEFIVSLLAACTTHSCHLRSAFKDSPDVQGLADVVLQVWAEDDDNYEA